MIVGACGFGSTGSSAVCDYLKEYNSFQTLDNIEFIWVCAVDGLIDLEHHVMHPCSRTADSIVAIHRYEKLIKKHASYLEKGGISYDTLRSSVDKFINAITNVTWSWDIIDSDISIHDKIKRYMMYRLNTVRKWELKNGKQWRGFPLPDVHLSVCHPDFYHAAKDHIRELIQAMGADFSKPIILDQPFSGNNPQACFPFYDDPYAIVVDRDPRDNYVFSRTKLLTRNHFMALGSVQDFVKYYRAIRDNQPYKEKNERVLSIRFEDMVYHYDETTRIINNFLHLPENPRPKTIFDPEISMPNTQVWKRFPEFSEDIKYIENELEEYLFDYNGLPEPDPNGEMFYGKSPKNK